MVMRTMREQTKWIMLLTAIAFVMLMVFEWGMDLSGRSSAEITGGELGRINGQPITYEEWLPVYRSLYDQQAQAQEEPISSSQNRQLEEAAWNQVLMDRLIAQELRRRGIVVTETEIRQAARYAPPPDLMQNEAFLTEGQFDLAKYHQFLASPAVDERLLVELERYYRDMIPRNKLYRQVTAGLYITDAQLWANYRDRNERARVQYVAIDPAERVADADVSVTDQEVSAYFEANQDDFQRPATATVRVVWLDQGASAADSAAALERARQVRQEILGGADFAEVAERESADPGSAAQGGELGTFQRGQMVPAFDQAVWSQPVGEVGEPVQSQFGWHIIRVDSREGDEATARHILISVEQSEETEERMLAAADSLDELLTTMPLDSAAALMGLRTRQAEINPDMPFVPGVGRVDEGSDWVFETDAAPEGASSVFENEQAFYALELVRRTPAGTLSLEEAEPIIRSRLMTQKKLERAREEAAAIARDVASGRSLEEAAQAAGLEVQEAGPFTRVDFVPGLGQANAAIGTAFGLREGQLSGAVEADGRLYIIKLLERQQASRQAFEEQKQMQRARAMQTMQQDILNRYLAELRERAEIVDNRATVLGPGPAQATS